MYNQIHLIVFVDFAEITSTNVFISLFLLRKSMQACYRVKLFFFVAASVFPLKRGGLLPNLSQAYFSKVLGSLRSDTVQKRNQRPMTKRFEI